MSIRNFMSSFHAASPSTTPVRRKNQLHSFIVAALFGVLSIGAFAQTGSYTQTNLISDGFVPANRIDPNLINPWGFSIGTNFWIDTPVKGLSLVTDGAGNSLFNVEVPPANPSAAHGRPAGVVFNSDPTLFMISGNGSAQFLFGTLDGTIAAWSPSTPVAVTEVNNSALNASYTGVALDVNANGTYLLGANFAVGTVDVFNSSFQPAQLAGSFSDPSIPSGYSPFEVQAISNEIFVTYALRNTATGGEVFGAGNGYVDVFDTNGNLLQRAISQGNLNAPWGVALAPAGFGSLGGNLLIGNFGDGTINAYDPTSFAFKGQVQDSTGAAITNTGLWGIEFGVNGVGDPNTLYIAAGLNNLADGVVAAITAAPPAAGANDFTFQSASSALTIDAGETGNATLSLAAGSGFSGPVSFSCTGATVTCMFTPATITLSGSGTQTVTVAITTPQAPLPPPPPGGYDVMNHPIHHLFHSHAGLALAFIGPFGLLALAGRKRRSVLAGGSLLALLLVMATAGMTGCSAGQGGAAGSVAPAPQAAAQVIINATSGTITHSVTITLNQ